MLKLEFLQCHEKTNPRAGILSKKVIAYII